MEELTSTPFPRGVGEDGFALGSDAVWLCSISFVFPVSQPPSRMGPGCLCGAGVSLFALPGRGGNSFPTPATRLAATAHLPDGGWLPQLLQNAGAQHKGECKPWGGKGGPTHPQLLFPPSTQGFSLADTVLLLPVIYHRLQSPGGGCSRWVAGVALGHPS